MQQRSWWQLGGIGLEGNPATNTLARQADLILTVGSRLTDFATGSHSLFVNPDVQFVSINVDPRDGDRLGAVSICADAKLSLLALTEELGEHRSPATWRDRVEEARDEWAPIRDAALDADTLVDIEELRRTSHDVIPATDAVLTRAS